MATHHKSVSLPLESLRQQRSHMLDMKLSDGSLSNTDCVQGKPAPMISVLSYVAGKIGGLRATSKTSRTST